MPAPLPLAPSRRRSPRRPSPRGARSLGALLPLALLPLATAGGQAASATLERAVDQVAAHPAVTRAMAALQRDNAWTLDQQVGLCEIPAPPFKEAERAQAFRDLLVSLGVQQVRLDGEGNVIGEVRGARPGPTVVLSGHLDTVFPEGTNVKVTRRGTLLTGPGIGDDCRGLAVTLAVARQLVGGAIPFAGRVLVVGTVGEEGPGNLRGVRALFKGPLRDSIDVFLSVDGTGFGITNGGVGSNRYRVRYVGPGGHSYGAFGMPNPIHALGRAIAGIAALQVPSTPKTTFNVGIVSGGTSVNSIAMEGVMDVDLRSESAASLAAVDAQLMTVLRRALDDEKARWPGSTAALALKIDTIGLRPAGSTPDTSRVVQVALAAARTMNVYAPLTISSTDANVPMELKIPAITLDGGGVGRGAHGSEESYDDRTDGFKGPQWVMLVVLGLLGVR